MSTLDQVVDVFTKDLPSIQFAHLTSKLLTVPPPSTCRGSYLSHTESNTTEQRVQIYENTSEQREGEIVHVLLFLEITQA